MKSAKPTSPKTLPEASSASGTWKPTPEEIAAFHKRSDERAKALVRNLNHNVLNNVNADPAPPPKE